MRYIVALVLSLYASQAYAAAGIGAAFSKFSSAGMSVDAGKQGTNTLQVIGGGAVSKPGGKPTLSIGPWVDEIDTGLTASAASAVSTNRALHISRQVSVTVNTDLSTLPELDIIQGGSFNVSVGVTLTLPVNFHAGKVKVFYGSGSVVGLRDSFPYHWGVTGTSDETPINLARVAVANNLGGTVHLSGSYTLGSSPIVTTRGIRFAGESMESTQINNAGAFPTFAFRLQGSAVPMNAAIENLKIVGKGSVLSGNVGIECAGGAQYVSIRNVTIKSIGDVGLNFNDADGTGIIPSIGNLNGASGSRGMLYSTIDNVTIDTPYGRGIYMTGNTGQNLFLKVRVIGCQGDAGVVAESNQLNATVLMNTFVGGGVESGGNPSSNTSFRAVWMKGASYYAAYDTKFINFYIEPGSTSGTGDVTGYYLEACKGVQISGHISFVHWGVVATSQYSEDITIADAFFYQSASWPGGTTGNLTGKYMVSSQNGSAFIHLGPGCGSSLNGITWGEIDTAGAGRVWGHLNLTGSNYIRQQTTILPQSGTAGNSPGATAANRGSSYFVQSASGLSDYLQVAIKTEADSYQVAAVGEMWSYNGTLSFPGTGSVAAGASWTSGNIAVTGAALGRFIRVAPIVDTSGWQLSVVCTGSGQAKISATNTTAGPLTIAAGTWRYAVGVR